jgi:mRNA-degrading endonuclease RelE of RelBE toxin-antitoxin system
MVRFAVELTKEANADLLYYPALEQKTIIAEMRIQLSHEPLAATRNRKPLRGNPARWELRHGRFRVFYEVDETSRIVTVTAVGDKKRERLFIRGNEVKL